MEIVALGLLPLYLLDWIGLDRISIHEVLVVRFKKDSPVKEWWHDLQEIEEVKNVWHNCSVQ